MSDKTIGVIVAAIGLIWLASQKKKPQQSGVQQNPQKEW